LTPQHGFAAVSLAAALLAACAGLEPPSFAPGTPMGDVEARMGKPRAVAKAPDGDTVWQYPTGPVGQWTYMVRVGPDQRTKSVYQALTLEQFAKIQPGISRDEVRLLLGPPGQTMVFGRMDEEVWSYRYQIPVSTNRIFNVHFDAATGRVRSTSDQEDPLFIPPIRVVG
jgi:hypothetical protein